MRAIIANPVGRALVPLRGTGIAFVILAWPAQAHEIHVSERPVVLESLPHRHKEVVTIGDVYRWLRDGVFKIVKVEDLPLAVRETSPIAVMIDAPCEVALV